MFLKRECTFYSAELFKMVCEENETDVTIGIPAVMLPHDAGDSLEKDLKDNMSGMSLISINFTIFNSFVFFFPSLSF